MGEFVKLLNDHLTKGAVAPPRGAVSPVPRATLWITHRQDGEFSFAFTGGYGYTSERSCKPECSYEDLRRAAQSIGRDVLHHRDGADGEARHAWRQTVRRHGGSLHRSVIECPGSGLAQEYGRAITKADLPENLTICFAGPMWHVGVPFEFLFAKEPLATNHPMCRQVTAVPGGPGMRFGDLPSVLCTREEALRVLLISADDESCTDVEVKALEECVERQGEELRVAVEVEHLLTKDATCSRGRTALDGCRHHLVQHCGP